MSWEPINLATVEQRPAVRPTLGSLGLAYPGRRHIFSGPPESLKTLVAQIETLEVIRAGGRVVLVDLETGPWDTRDRLRDLGATDDELAAVLYIEPDTPPTEETIAVLVALGPDLVVIDAAAGAYDIAGLDDNKRQDVERFATLYVRGFWKAGIATILLDHVVKSAEGRGRYAIGSERKLGGCDVHLGFEAVTPLSRGHRGVVKVTVHKDRFGHLSRPVAATLQVTSDPNTHHITWALEADMQASDWRPTILMARVVSFLETQTDSVNRRTIEQNVTGRAEYVRKAIDLLVRDDDITEIPGPGSSRLYALTKRVRPAVPDSSQLVPDDHEGGSSRSSHPLQGGRRDEDEVDTLPGLTSTNRGATDGADASHAREEPASP